MNHNFRYLGSGLFFRQIAVPAALDMERVLHDYIANSPAVEKSDRARVANIIIESGSLTPQTPIVLGHLQRVTCFPEGFNPQGNVKIFKCPSFTGFPEEFNPQGNVIVEDCSVFTGFPEGFNARGNVTVNDCPAFTRIPESFFSMPSTSRVDLCNTGLNASTVHMINERQNEPGYNGPRFILSIRDQYQSEVARSAADLGVLLQGFGYRSDDNGLIRYAMAQTEVGSPWTDLATFLTRLLNETPRPDGEIPDVLKATVRDIVLDMTLEYAHHKDDLSACSLINGVLAAASSGIGTCIDKVKVGYVLMQLHHRIATTEGEAQVLARQSLDRVTRTIEFVEKVNDLSVVYDQKSGHFEALHIAPVNVGETTADYSATVGATHVDMRGLSLEMSERDIRGVAIATLNTEPDASYRVFRIGDEVEDILSLIYQQGIDVHQIEIRYVGCVTLREDIVVAAALGYISSSSMSADVMTACAPPMLWGNSQREGA